MNFIEQILISEVVSDNIRIFYAVPHNVLYLGLIHSKKVKMCSKVSTEQIGRRVFYPQVHVPCVLMQSPVNIRHNVLVDMNFPKDGASGRSQMSGNTLFFIPIFSAGNIILINTLSAGFLQAMGPLVDHPKQAVGNGNVPIHIGGLSSNVFLSGFIIDGLENLCVKALRVAAHASNGTILETASLFIPQSQTMHQCEPHFLPCLHGVDHQLII